ncbi:MAG: hypothetical protein WBP46_05615 [Thiolinea sp.]
MKKLVLLAVSLGLAGAAVAWNPWSAWHPTQAAAQKAAVASCKEHYGYACAVYECQKRYYNYAYEWRCAAKQAYTPPAHYSPPAPTY